MVRARLLILITSALLTTSVVPFGTEAEGSDAKDRIVGAIGASVEASGGAVDASVDAEVPYERDGAVAANALNAADETAFSQVLARLRVRHTALPSRERVALARTIVKEARSHGLDPALVIAIIEVESGGYHLAVSHVGAMGLMQLLPTTGEELAGKLGIEWHGPDTLFDPTINVKLGTAYLRQLADRYGDVSVALAAYNWGPGRIDRRLRRGAGVPSRYIEQVMRAVDRDVRPASRRS